MKPPKDWPRRSTPQPCDEFPPSHALVRPLLWAAGRAFSTDRKTPHRQGPEISASDRAPTVRGHAMSHHRNVRSCRATEPPSGTVTTSPFDCQRLALRRTDRHRSPTLPTPPMSVRHSLDHLIGGGQQRFRDGEAERFGGFEVDHMIKFGDLLHR